MGTYLLCAVGMRTFKMIVHGRGRGGEKRRALLGGFLFGHIRIVFQLLKEDLIFSSVRNQFDRPNYNHPRILCC